MRSEDHLALGLYLLSQRNSPQLRRRCIAFLIGCTEPDCNQFSYLRGIVHHRKFRGHNAEHSMEPDCRFIFAACSSLLRQELERIPAEAVQPDSFAARSGFLRRVFFWRRRNTGSTARFCWRVWQSVSWSAI